MRGTLLVPVDHRRSERFIPAYAGNTNLPESRLRGGTVHPRVCGEHKSGTAITTRIFGSSPRMRGTLFTHNEEADSVRFIPAYAGNTTEDRQYFLAPAVHPRVCGEHSSRFLLHFHCSGSSPRMRGTPRFRSGSPRPVRFIPAYAGNTLRRKRRSRRAAVHPRVCGEHNLDPALGWNPAGSSPRMRGTLSFRPP